MNVTLSRLLLIGLLVVGSSMVLPHSASAQATEGIQLKPAVVEDRVNPGDTYHFSIRVTNISNEDKTFYLDAQDIKSADSQGHPIFAPAGEPTGFELSSWISIPAGAITIKAGETKEIPLIAKVPKTASPGAHFGGIFFDSKPPNVAQNGSGVGIRVGSIIDLRIAGDIVEDASMREFSTDKLVYSVPKVAFSAKVENKGNVLARPRGIIEVTDMWGKKISTIPVNDGVSAVFPGTTKEFPSEWSYDGLAFGRYQAVISLVYGDEARRTISSATSFWILPVRPILTTLAIIVAIVVGLYFIVRSYIRRKLRQMGISSTQRVAADLYTQKYNRSSSRLFFLVLGISVFVLVFLIALFVMFA